MKPLKAEWLKMKKKNIKMLLGLYGVLLVIISLFYGLGEQRWDLIVFNKGQFLVSSLKVMMGFVLPVLSLYLSSSLFGSEMQQGTFKNMFLLPVDKGQIYLNKLLAIFTALGLLLGLQFIYSGLISIILDGFISIDLLGTYLLSYLGAWMTLGLIAIIGSVVTLLIKSNGLVIILGYVSYLGLNILNIYFPIMRPISLPTIMGQYHHLFSSGSLIQLLSLIAYYIIIVSVGFLIFEQRNDDICQLE